MAAIIYSLCALTSVVCLVLLWRSQQSVRSRLLFWSSMCFLLFAANNILLVVDKLLLPKIDLGMARLVAALVAVLLLIVGLILEEE